MARAAVALLACLTLLVGAASAQAAEGPVKAGAAVLDGTYHVGNSAGQYSTTRNKGYGDYDPHASTVKNVASYGVQARQDIRALVVQGSDGELVALIGNDNYIPQDSMFKRTAQLAAEMTGGRLNSTNITMATTHNHSSPSHSSISWGVWTFQDAFDFRYFEYYARQQAVALKRALDNLHDVRISATVSHFDKITRTPLGPSVSDDGTPAGFPDHFTDHDLAVVRFENIDRGPHRAEPLATLVNYGQHPEFLKGVDVISGEYVRTMQRFVDREVGGVTIFTQNSTGTSEIEKETYQPLEARAAFDHTQYGQMEWAARRLADAVVDNVDDISRQRPNKRDAPPVWGGPSYEDRFVGWMSGDFEVGMESRWFPGPVSHPYPAVSSCRSDPLFAGNPRIPVAGLPDCREVPIGNSIAPVTGALPVSTPGLSTDTLTDLGVPFPETYGAPSTVALQDTLGAHLQAFRLGDILFTVCSCEQWAEQSFNVKTRTDRITGNEWLGYDPTDPPANDPNLSGFKPGQDQYASNRCVQNGDGSYAHDGTGTGTWTCQPGKRTLSDELVQRMRSRILNDAAGWDDPACTEIGCGAQGEAEPSDITEIRGNFTHDDTDVRGGRAQSREYADEHGYRLVVTISMANDYNGYIATYRDFMARDHYRKALTAFGPHSSDYLATRMVRMGQALKGDEAALREIDQETVPAKAAPKFAALAAKEAVDQAAEEAKVRAVGEFASAGVKAYDATLPDDGGTDPGVTPADQPQDVERFDAATFSWVGGNNYTDNPFVTVERRHGNKWVPFADQSGEVQTMVTYPASDPSGYATYRQGGQVWKWKATFEAFVSRFNLIDPQGHRYRATPEGTYRFVVSGTWRKGRQDAAYTRVSEPFRVAPWSGITVENLRSSAGRVAFDAGPRRHVSEGRVRGTTRPALADGPVPFTIGPVDYPDTVKDQRATGFRFLNDIRSYSGVRLSDGSIRAEHYCLDCRFRDWLDVTGTGERAEGGDIGTLHAEVRFLDADGQEVAVERLQSEDGSFLSSRELAEGETAEVLIRDEWDNHSGEPQTIEG